MILITGTPGWLGNRLLRILVEGFPDKPELLEKYSKTIIRCLCINKRNQQIINQISDRFNCFIGDIRDKDSLKHFFENSKGATLFHLAGIIHPKKIQDLYDINTIGLENTLEIASKSGVKRAIIISSNSPIGCNTHNDHVFDELSNYNPYMNYGKSKKLGEEIAIKYYTLGKLEIVILRPCWFYGPEQPERQTLFFNMIQNGKMPVIGGGKYKRSMSYVDNTCQGLLLADQVDSANGQIYWIADENPYSMKEIVDTVKYLLKNEFNQIVSEKNIQLPYFVSEFALIIDKMIQSIGLYNQKLHVLSEMNKTIACSIEKAKKELNFMPLVNLEEGMYRSIKWCIDQGYIS